MVDQNRPKVVTPPEGERLNFYLRLMINGIGGVVLGALILLFYLYFLLPAFRENLRTMGIIALFLMPCAFLINYFVSIRRSKRLIEWMKADIRSEPVDEELWHAARDCAIKLPRLSATFSLILWLSAPCALALIMLIMGRFGWYQAGITAISGLLIGPLNALAFFYTLRQVMFQALKRLDEYPIKPREVVAPPVSLRFKLIFSYTCLVICPMLFAVILDRHQGDKQITERRKTKTEATLKQAAQIWNRTKSWDDVDSFVAETKIPQAHYFAVDNMGKVVYGLAPERFVKQAFEHPAKGATQTVYLHHMDRLLSIEPVGDEKVLLLAVYHRLDDTRGFWGRNWLVACLLIALGVYGVILGIDASRDTMRPVLEMMASSERVRNGNFTARGVYLNDDELAGLGEVFNKLIENIKEQLEISGKMVGDIRSAIVHLSKNSDEVYEVVTKQRTGVGDQMMGLNQAQSVAGEITDAARSIQEKAGSIHKLSERTSADCITGSEVLDGASDRVRNISVSMDEISRRMDELTAHCENILQVVNLIEEINERTDLLALNASLEAVGAKRAGSRFAVVAQEVRRLAEKTAQSTTQIQSLFEAIKESSNACIDTIGAGHQRAGHGLKMMDRLTRSFDEISANAKATSEAVAQIHMMTTQQTSSCLQMQDTITDVAGAGKMVEEGADVAEETVRSLSNLATNLKALVQTDE